VQRLLSTVAFRSIENDSIDSAENGKYGVFFDADHESGFSF
jgi:hypothetical protein